MTPEEYIYSILVRETADTGPSSPALGVRATLLPKITEWAGAYLDSFEPSGSFAKGTANRTGTDIDLFISLKPSTPHTLKELYEKLGEKLTALGYVPRKQNVSWNINVDGFDVDLVPARQQDDGSSDHSLFRRRADTWTKTNVAKHIATVRAGGRTRETRLMKLWRDQQGLDFPSFYLELAVIRALGVATPAMPATGTWGGNLGTVFRYLCDSFVDARIEDPANSDNVISDDLSANDKASIKAAAGRALLASTWAEVIR